MGFFDVLICAEDTTSHKPEPGPYLAALSKLGCQPREGLAFEDSPNGILSAKAAGLFCVAVPNPVTRGLALDRADLLVDSLDALSLEELMEKIQKRS